MYFATASARKLIQVLKSERGTQERRGVRLNPNFEDGKTSRGSGWSLEAGRNKSKVLSH